jgi:hypothetical protein
MNKRDHQRGTRLSCALSKHLDAESGYVAQLADVIVGKVRSVWDAAGEVDGDRFGAAQI